MGAAFAQSPDVPPVPVVPDVATITENCGEGCTRTTTTVRTTETTADGTEVQKKDVEVIEINTSASDQVDVDVDVEKVAENGKVVRKQVRVVKSLDGEISPEMQAEIDAMLAELETGADVSTLSGDGVVVLNKEDGEKKMHIVVRQAGEEAQSNNPAVDIDQIDNPDGSQTIRITPKDGGDTTVITIDKETAAPTIE